MRLPGAMRRTLLSVLKAGGVPGVLGVEGLTGYGLYAESNFVGDLKEDLAARGRAVMTGSGEKSPSPR
jgi:hypothetical protein